MIEDFCRKTIDSLKESGNIRTIPQEPGNGLIDLSTNDYMGVASNRQLLERFFYSTDLDDLKMSSAASRLLSAKQSDYIALEKMLKDLYHRPALLFNSGYHANTGIIPAIADRHTVVLADRLVHASIIDGIKLSQAKLIRFRHNDFEQLERTISDYYGQTSRILVITESVFSMDGDIADLHRLAEIKRQYPDIITYIDEAHAFGVRGKHGLGVIEETGTIDKFDIVIGTFGKAVASIGAFAIASAVMKDFLINKARSLIFSTALPPISCRWSKFVIEFLLGMDKEREYLLNVSEYINCKFEKYNHNIRSHSQIVPLIIGDSSKAVMLSSSLRQSGFIALPIRHPTVPAGTERIRFSLNANIRKCDIDKLIELINIYETSIYQ